MIRRVVARACLAAMLAPLWACSSGPEARASYPPMSAEEWRVARARLAELRRETDVPRTLNVKVRLHEPLSNKVLDARGAVAVVPPRGLRMILLGPGGTTALDLWVEGDRYRFAVPAIDLLRRGDGHEPREARRGLPVDFLRWWLLRPTSGELIWAGREPEGERFVIRDEEALVELFVRKGGAIEARRSSWTHGDDEARKRIDDETIFADQLGCARVQYRQASTGLEVTVECESERLGAPNARALEDPDGGEK